MHDGSWFLVTISWTRPVGELVQYSLMHLDENDQKGVEKICLFRVVVTFVLVDFDSLSVYVDMSEWPVMWVIVIVLDVWPMHFGS